MIDFHTKICCSINVQYKHIYFFLQPYTNYGSCEKYFQNIFADLTEACTNINVIQIRPSHYVWQVQQITI